MVLMATVSSFEGMAQPGRYEQKQFAELFEPVFRASSLEARRNAVAALSRCPTVPSAVAWFIACQPIALAAIFIASSPAIDDEMLIQIARTQGPLHAKAVATRDNLSVKVVDALVSLHSGHEMIEAAPRTDDVLADEQGFVIDPSEALRQRLKALVQRDTLAAAQETPDGVAETQTALLVRFARLREPRAFSTALAEALGASRWLSERIMLDLSGHQLATALMALGLSDEDGPFMLAQLYPHLAQPGFEANRALELWRGLNPERCDERVAAWLRADDYTQGKAPDEDEEPANRNVPSRVDEVGVAVPFGRRRTG